MHPPSSVGKRKLYVHGAVASKPKAAIFPPIYQHMYIKLDRKIYQPNHTNKGSFHIQISKATGKKYTHKRIQFQLITIAANTLSNDKSYPSMKSSKKQPQPLVRMTQQGLEPIRTIPAGIPFIRIRKRNLKNNPTTIRSKKVLWGHKRSINGKKKKVIFETIVR